MNSIVLFIHECCNALLDDPIQKKQLEEMATVCYHYQKEVEPYLNFVSSQTQNIYICVKQYDITKQFKLLRQLLKILYFMKYDNDNEKYNQNDTKVTFYIRKLYEILIPCVQCSYFQNHEEVVVFHKANYCSRKNHILRLSSYALSLNYYLRKRELLKMWHQDISMNVFYFAWLPEEIVLQKIMPLLKVLKNSSSGVFNRIFTPKMKKQSSSCFIC